MANVSYLRRPSSDDLPARGWGRRLSLPFKRPGPWAYVVGAAVAVLLVLGAAAIALVASSTSLTPGPRALADIGLPLGGGKVESVAVTGGPRDAPIPAELRGTEIWPSRRIPSGELVSIEVVVKRPGLISWLTGSTDRVHLTFTTPTARLRNPYLTLAQGAALSLRFTQSIQRVSYGQPGALKREYLAQPESTVQLPRTAAAGSELVYAAPRTWEKVPAATVSWFPAGARASAVANPAPGSRIGASTPITLTFSQPVQQALAGHMPPVSPATPGTWHAVNSHTITFQPEGYGYGLGVTVSIGMPNSVRLVGGSSSWTVPPGSTLRLQQLLSLLGYLPVTFHYRGAGVALTPQAQEQAAIDPPKGTFTWRYPNTPGVITSGWDPGVAGTITRGAIMAFEDDQGMTTDGIASAAVWRALISTDIARKPSTFGYTVVTVSEGSPETESTWHNGKVVVSGLVNTGIPGASTALGLYPVFEHALSVTMSGTNPDGSHYDDPGVPYVSYFNGGDALHGFLRGSYGVAQSLGCVEMPYSEAAAVYPYTPIGTLVNVVS